MNKGEQVVAIKTIEFAGITKGSIYDIITVGKLNMAIFIKNDFGDELWYTIKNNFITLAEFRNNRINEILND